MNSILITGGAGFIGSHTALRFANLGFEVTAVDSLSPYYSVNLKRARVQNLLRHENIHFVEGTLANEDFSAELIGSIKPTSVIHLAAQPGVRLPVSEHFMYVDSNLKAFSNVILECAKQGVPKFLYASSSSVYGNSKNVPFSETDKNIKPISFYGATKLSNEILASSVSTNFGMATRGLRFFTVYGPWGRPDMAYFKLATSLMNQTAFSLYGDGKIRRDFTFVDDVVESIVKLTSQLEEHTSFADVVNVGGSQRYSMLELIEAIENAFGSKVNISIEDVFSADVNETWADTTYLESLIEFKPKTDLTSGIESFVKWINSSEIQKQRYDWNI